MLLKYFCDRSLAHASYMVGCQRAKVAVVIDPGRDIDQYLDMADREGVRLIAVAETHIHADYVSGARELADRVGAKLFVSDAGPADWKYQFVTPYDHQLLKDGDSFLIGNIKFDVMHIPGHPPESISFVLTDQGGGVTAKAGAHELFHSAERFKTLPDYLQIWPAHGAGGARSAIAASILQAAGRHVINMTGGCAAWSDAGLPCE